jgi:preprotein translocase subunit SecA
MRRPSAEIKNSSPRSPRFPTKRCATGPRIEGRVANGETLDAVLPDAFAVVRGAGSALQMRRFDVQLLGRMALHNGLRSRKCAGEQDARRHAPAISMRWRQGRAYGDDQRLPRPARRRLDGAHLQVPGTHGRRQSVADESSVKQAAYAADITYGTNNEFGFDCDNMVFAPSGRCSADKATRSSTVDSILIDRRAPLITQGQADDNVEDVLPAERLAPKLKRRAEEKGLATSGSTKGAGSAVGRGHEHAEAILGLAGLIPAARACTTRRTLR